MGDKSESLSFKTVFVQGIPQTCSNEQLTELFSTQGPVKKAFVVKKKFDNPRQSIVGYVEYHKHEDAKAASQAPFGMFEVNQTKLKVQFARKRVVEDDGKKKKFEKFSEKSELNQNLSILERLWSTKCKMDVKPEPEGAKYQPKQQASNNHCVMVSTASNEKINLSTLQSLWAEKKLKRPAKVLVDGESNILYAMMASKQDCLKAVTKLNGQMLGLKTLRVFFLMDPKSKDFEKTSKKSRLVVRNLSFACTEEDLVTAFEQHGLITDCKIPVTADGKKRGYGFIQFTHPFEAERAIRLANMTEIKGRKVAVDWSVPKEKYKSGNKADDVDNVEDAESAAAESGSDEDSDADSLREEDSDDEGGEDDSENHDSQSEDDDEENGEDDEDDETEEADKSEAKRDKNYSSDVHQQKTLFLRNLSYDVNDEELGEFMKKFGETKYCKVVENPQTGMSKGCGFVQFIDKDDADKCLRMLNDDDEGVTLRGRRFNACVALDRAQSNKIKMEKQAEKKEVNDKRNMHLANEGLIRPGTLAANGLSEIELKKRARIEQSKRTKLKNPEVFVSPLRLCVHNLPRATTDDKLKEIFVKALKDCGEVEEEDRVRVTESRIMRDREKVNAETGVARSLGFGYVKFAKHQHALAALRFLNNNPDIFTNNKRPIVEFSLENRKALETQKMRAKRHKAKLALKSKMSVDGKDEKSANAPPKAVNKKKARRLERRAKERAQTNEAKQWRKDGLLPSLDHYQPQTTTTTTVASKKQEAVEKKVVKQEERKRHAFQGSVGTSHDGRKMKSLKHIGPKIRKRDKGKVLERLRESKKLNRAQNKPQVEKTKVSRKERDSMASMAGTSTRKRARSSYNDLKSDKEFNDLVSMYAKKFRSGIQA